MTRIVQVSFHLDRAGRDAEELLEAWPTLAGVAAAAARTGLEVAVVQPAAADRTLLKDGVEYHFVRERAGLRRGPPGTRPVSEGAPRLGRVVQSLEPDLVHIQSLSLPGHARSLSARLPGVPLLAQDHADRPPSPWRLPRARRDARAWKAVAFTAREQAIPFREAGLLGASVPVHEVLEASSDFSPGDRRDARRQTGIHGDPAFLWVGHLDANKDPLTVLDGLATVLPRFVDPHLWCCYRTAPLLTEVRSRIAGHPRLAGLAGRVHLLGERPASEIELLLRAADAFVLGSHREGSGYAVLEAMACGTPPIVTGVPSLRRIAGPGLASLLWTPGNAGACAAALGRLAVEDPADLRARTRLRFEQALAWDAVGRELRAAYDACLDGAQSPAAAR